MNVIALFSFPQECGDDSLRLVSCGDGQVVFDLNLSTNRDPEERKVNVEILSEIGTFYDQCTVQKHDIGDNLSHIPHIFGTYEDSRCAKPLYKSTNEFWKKYKEEYLTIISCHKLNKVSNLELDGKTKEVYLWKYTVAKAEKNIEYIYHPEWDSVYQEIKKRCNIECPLEERYDYNNLALKISEALGYKLLNVLFG